jgi:outer membrane protein
MRRIVPTPALAIGLLAIGLVAPATEASAATLTLAEAVAAGARAHPSLKVADAQRDAAQARVGEAFAGYLPSLTFNGLGRADYASFPPNVPGTPTGAPPASAKFVGTSRYSASLNLSQTVYDFGRTGWTVASARAAVEGSRADRETARMTVELGVVQAYYGVLQAQALKRVAEEALAQADQHAAQANELYQVGTRPEIDVASAESQRAQARLQLVHAANAVDIAKVALNSAMGVEAAIDYDVVEAPMAPVGGEDGSIDALTSEAVKSRPDYASVQRQIEAAAATTHAAFAGYLPIVGAGGAAVGTGTDTAPGPFYDFSAQLTLTQPIFSGLLTKRTVEEDRALERAAEANLESLRQGVRLAVATAALAVREGREAVEAAHALEAQAEKQLAMATGRYRAGVGNIIELVDAQQGAVSARAQKIQADYTLAVDRATLTRALGRRIVAGSAGAAGDRP